MAEKEPIIEEKLDHSGIFEFKAVYSFAHKWLKEEGFGVIEEKYSEKVAGNSRDISVKWTIEKKLTDYFKIEGEVEIEVKGLIEVEVEIDSEKKRTNKGKISIGAKAMLISDPESKWDENAFLKFFREIYNEYVIPHRVDKMKSYTENKIKSFKEELKALFEMMGRR